MSGSRLQLTLRVLALLLTLAVGAAGAGRKIHLTGKVVDPEGTPVPGATIILLNEGQAVTGGATNSAGEFKLSFPAAGSDQLRLRVSSVSFEPTFVDIPGDKLTDPLKITLMSRVVEVDGITISPAARPEVRKVDIPQEKIARRARMSLVATNPTAALQEPDISRSGSSHSSQLRVHGTNPTYYLNGLPIGTDPAHYGMFCFIPSSVVSNIEFQALGAGAKYNQPSVVEFESPAPFGERVGGDVNLSTIDLTGTFSIGGKRWYAVGSVRKSVLDRLVKTIQGTNDRTTLPPTNFQDVFASVGFDLGCNVTLVIDQYHVRDYLKYNTSVVTKTAEGTITTQESREDFVGARLRALRGNVLLKAEAGIVNERHQYHAVPEVPSDTAPHLFVDLREYQKVAYAGVECDLEMGEAEVQLGVQSRGDLRGDFDLAQQNWNFLPPFSNTDNPFIYQQALNEAYSNESGDLRGWDHAAYMSITRTRSRFTLEAGARLDTYALLAVAGEYTYRLRVAWQAGERSQLELFHGTFSESPVDNILEAYQVLIRANIRQLRPVKTELWSAGFTTGSFRFSLFNKLISNLPVPTPDFEQPLSESGTVSDDFIRITSTGSARFWGGSVAFERSGFLVDRLSLYASYAYTRAHRVDNGVETRYELDAPHKALVQMEYGVTSALSLTADLQVRSGYPYSPLRAEFVQDESRLYTESYYQQVMSRENSQRFPTHAYLNLGAAYDFGSTELFLSLSNVTNRANPIINASTGLIYDAGITPMLGLKVSF